ncbi:MAG: TonB family protein [Parvularculaceae bacterium]|nr:TonB family protein [Parvularculaceae bacterium]
MTGFTMNAPQRSVADVAISDTDAKPQADIAPPANDEAPLSTGKKLAALRAEKGLRLEDVFAATKVKRVHLAAIETDDFRALPAIPYAAGFVKAYAQYLGLDPDAYAAAWRRDATGAVKTPVIAVADKEPQPAKPAFIPPVKAAPPAPVVSSVEAPADRASLSLTQTVIAPASEGRKTETQTVIAYTAMAATAVAIAVIAAHSIAVRKPLAVAEAPAAREAVQADMAAPMQPVVTAVELTEPATEIAIAEPAVEETSGAVSAPGEPRPVIEETRAAPAAERMIERVAVAPEPEFQPEPEPSIEVVTESETVDAAAAPTFENVATPTGALIDEPVAVAPPHVRAPVIVEAAILRAPAPRYPERCAPSASAIEEVAILIDVARDGRPDKARVAETSNECFNNAALSAAERMRFEPKTIDGAPARELARRVTIRFAR